jgi:phage gp36-like protein
MGTYIDADKLKTALTTRTYEQLFVLDPTAETADIDTDAVDQVIRRAEAQVNSYLLGFYTYPLDPATDALIEDACLMYACAYAFMRNPEYVRTYGEVGKVQTYIEAKEMMLRIQAAKQRLPDVAQVSKPKNLGGIVSPTGPILIGNCPGDF